MTNLEHKTIKAALLAHPYSPLGAKALVALEQVVEQDKRCVRCVRAWALSGAFFAAWCIHRFEHRVQEHPLPVHIETAPPLIVVRMRLVYALGEIQVAVIAGRLIGLGARSAGFADEKTRDGECVITDQLRR